MTSGPVRVGVYSDVHADLRALRALCVEFERASVDQVWCLGDFASGGCHPAECFDLTMSTASLVLGGNHEQFIVGQVWTVLDGGWARHARIANAELGAERVERLKALQPHDQLPELGVELAHGSLEDPWSGFVNDAADAELTLRRASQPVLLVGHSHRAAYFRQATETGLPESRVIELGREEELDCRCILNPGAGFDERWLELQLGAGRRSATWHRVDIA